MHTLMELYVVHVSQSPNRARIQSMNTLHMIQTHHNSRARSEHSTNYTSLPYGSRSCVKRKLTKYVDSAGSPNHRVNLTLTSFVSRRAPCCTKCVIRWGVCSGDGGQHTDEKICRALFLDPFPMVDNCCAVRSNIQIFGG